ncbi:putative isoflavone-7-O-beta-glucoside 6''-O-malonyltransferase [Rosa chinensis]|uniref:Putative isoflavone-7-O-beta-glucoside 6''-O-malonyltransferase n=1 Tax=Rosa chinensis TaxID=74649 RepID=A0A2P6Q9L6_ROSCH|nr:putative isoflavone-7-O-beta-glucoside 6''-O-malonyltransferase [Rosa chinensis]
MANPNPNPVKVVEVCRVTPQPASASKSLPLTFFDLLWLRFEPFKRLFFYEASNTALFFKSILPRLKTSLSLTLHHFSPLAGNLTWPKDSPKPILSYVKGNTVSLTIAEYYSNDDHAGHDHFHRLSSSDFLEAKEYYSLVPQLDVSHDRATVLALQITVFPNRGFSIGTAMHHAVLDGNSLTLFFKLWAHICKHHEQLATSSSLLADDLKPCYTDRLVIEDPLGLEAIYSKQWLDMGGPNNRSLKVWEIKSLPGSIRATFEFTKAKIQTLGQHVKTVMNSDSLHLSAFALTCAYTWVCLVKAEETKGEKVLIYLSADYRSRLAPPISANYFGNCTGGCAAVAETKGLLGEDGFVVALKAISEAIMGLKNEGVLLDGAESWLSKLCTVQGGDRILSTAGSPRFEIYETDFGWGRPKRTEVLTIDKTGSISFSDSKNGGGGIEVGLVLEEHLMGVFASLFAKGLLHTPLIN